jgi:hypothetical protein
MASAMPAQAFVRTRSTSSTGPGVPAYWPGGCVFIQPDSGGTPDLPLADVTRIVSKSVANWMDLTSSCSYLKVQVDAAAPGEAHYDGTNVVKFRTDKWCHPEDAQDHDVCYDSHAAAITSVFMINDGDPSDGLILDADIEMNDINFTFVEVIPGQVAGTPRPGTSNADLENTLTHELGHLMGLSHTCRDQASFKNDVDETGAQPPLCDDVKTLPQAQRDKIMLATMYNFAQPGEVAKRSPTDDDIAGICNAYPIAALGDKTCDHTILTKYTRRGGCDVSPGRGERFPLFGLLCLGLVVSGLFAYRARRRRG